MKGVLIAGGYGTRLSPLTPIIDKHSLLIYNRPMIFYAIRTLLVSGINEMCLVLGRNAQQIVDLIRNIKEFERLNYDVVIQDKPDGISGALYHAKNFVGKENLFMILGDTNTDVNFSKDISDFQNGSQIFIKEVSNPNQWSVPEFDSNGNIVKIHEKPTNHISDYAVTGLGFYDNSVFKKIEMLKPSSRGELELGDLNNLFINEGSLKWKKLNGFWKDTGTFDLILEASIFWKHKELKRSK